MVPPPELLDFIKKGRKFLIAGHKEPDGDCVGSQLALASALGRMGKEAVLCSAGPFRRNEVKTYEPLFASQPDQKGVHGVIIVDCSSRDRTGDLEPFLEGLPLAVIDHHETNASLGGGLFYIDKDAPSTTALVMKLIEALGLEPTKEEAEFLFFGLCTDTGFFRHVDGEGAETFDVAARLVRFGANPKAAYRSINGGKSLNSRKLLGHILIRAESFFDGKLILSSEKYEDTRTYGLESRDSDNLFRLINSIDEVEAIVIIRQESLQNCTVGLRSRGQVDVAAIAASFGGGGHKNAAGLSFPGTMAELKPRLIKAFEDVFNDRGS